MAAITQESRVRIEDIEWFERSGVLRAPRYDFATARISPSGHMVLNRVAVEDLGNPTHITFGFSPRHRLVALRPSTANQVSAYKLSKTAGDSFQLNFGAFMKVHGLGRMRRNTYVMSMSQGMGLIAPDSDPVVPS